MNLTLRIIVALAIFLGVGELLARELDLVDRLNPAPRRLYMAPDDPACRIGSGRVSRRSSSGSSPCTRIS